MDDSPDSSPAVAAPTQVDRPLILDFGMHRGEDTAFYLAAGASVIGVEANAELVAANQSRFADAIADGRLTIVEGAIAPPDYKGDSMTFYVDRTKTVWGTTSSAWAERNVGLGSGFSETVVPVVKLDALLGPLRNVRYVKIDIEGADRTVLEAIGAQTWRPDYLSIESNKVDLAEAIAEIELMQSLGYTRFAAVQQATIPGRRLAAAGLTGAPFEFGFEEHASGPFGPYLAQPYKSAAEVIEDYRAIFRRYAQFGDTSLLLKNPATRLMTKAVNRIGIRAFGRPLCGWYDTHAAR